MPTFQCPHCEAEIDHIQYSQDVREYGSATLTVEGNGNVVTDDWNHEDTGDSDNTEFYCPECDHEVSLSEVIVTDGRGERLERTERHLSPANAWSVPNGANALANYDFCSACHDLKAKTDLTEGKCETCRN